MGYVWCNGVYRILLVLISTFAILISDAIGLDLSVRPMTEGRVREGGTLVITCRVYRKQPLDLVQIVRRIGEREYEVATNDYLKDKYRSTGRYWITLWNDTQGILEVTISETRGEDSGNLGCRHIPSSSSTPPETKFIDLIVDVRPSSVDLLYEARDGRWYKAEEGERIQFKSGIRCNVQMDGTDFEPRVQVSVDNGPDLHATKSIHKELGDNDGFTKITHSVQHTVQLDGTDLRFHGKALTCSVTMPQFSVTKKSLILEVPHKPQLSCPGEWLALPCAENYTITCRALMFPEISSHVWSWGMREEQKLINGKPNNEDIERFKSWYYVNERGEYVFKMVIAEVKNKDFGVYHLNVSNQHGFDQVSLAIVKEATVTLPLKSTTLKPLQLVVREDPSPYQLAKTSGTAEKIAPLHSIIVLHVILLCVIIQ